MLIKHKENKSRWKETSPMAKSVNLEFVMACLSVGRSKKAFFAYPFLTHP